MRRWFLAVPILLVLPAARLLGGWAIVTVDQLPEYLVSSEPVSLRFTVRQHGRTLLNGLHPTLEAREGDRVVRADAAPGSGAGRYVAALILPEPGDWKITIHSGFGSTKLALLPIPVIRRGAAPPSARADAERGMGLFVAKGCQGCHVRSEAGLAGGEEIGPPLTGKRYQAEYLRRFLTDPGANPTHTGSIRMPNLGLQAAEIASLVAFINADRIAAK